MPRKKLTYTHLFPYHICARANNKDNFPLPLYEMWRITTKLLNKASLKYKLHIHAYVLMSNHYHLVASTHEDFNIGQVMCWLQTSISKAVNHRTQRINHTFGGTYKASLITSPTYFANVIKYVYRNPVKAKLCGNVKNYKFSTLNSSDCFVTCLINGIYSKLPTTEKLFISWLNESYEDKIDYSIQKGLTKTLYKPVFNRTPRI